MLNFFYK